MVAGTRGIISIFSARQPPEDGGIPAPLFPDQMPGGFARGDRSPVNAVVAHPMWQATSSVRSNLDFGSDTSKMYCAVENYWRA
jgi:hypothetical protein